MRPPCQTGRHAPSPAERRRTAPGVRATPLCLVHVGVELVALELELVDALLHDVTDADHAGQLTLRHHRYVPDPPFGHQRHQLVDLVGDLARGDVAGHDLAHGGAEHTLVLVEPAYDVALRDDALHGRAVAADDESADVVLGEDAQEIADGRPRLDGDHVTARLGLKHVFDLHEQTLVRWPLILKCLDDPCGSNGTDCGSPSS